MVGKSKQPGTALLVSPGGAEYTASTPAEVINLVYGQGYQPKSGSAEDAVAAVTDQDGDSA